MPHFVPFKAIRPPRDKAHLVASRSYISYSKGELKDKLNGNPFTFLHIINPEASLGLKRTKNTVSRFKRVRQRFDEWLAKAYLMRDPKPAFYIYRQIQENHSFTGLVGCTSVMDYETGHIKIHEHTLTEREQVFVQYLENTGFHAEPVLLTYPDIDSVNALISAKVEERPEYDFCTTDTIRHQLWLIDDKPSMVKIQNAFDKIPDFYIADGHHRSASSYSLALKHKKGAWDKADPRNYFMSLLMPESDIVIAPFHRLVRDTAGLSIKELLERLSADFTCQAVSNSAAAKPTEAHEFGMYIEKQWYRLKFKHSQSLPANPVQHLDPQIISSYILQPILAIGDLKTDPRISCIGGNGGPADIERAVNKGEFAVGFWLHPTSVAEVKTIADHGLFMPPKSTWVEPKLRSGLTVYPFDND